MLWHLQIDPAPGRVDRAGHQVVSDAAELGIPGAWSVAASRGFIDEVIQPRTTRMKLIGALESLSTKRDKNPPKKHGNIPL